MKDPKDRATGDLLVKRGRGRPRKDNPKSAALRNKEYREGLRREGVRSVLLTAEQRDTLYDLASRAMRAAPDESIADLAELTDKLAW